jgi:hypothetical protein
MNTITGSHQGRASKDEPGAIADGDSGGADGNGERAENVTVGTCEEVEVEVETHRRHVSWIGMRRAYNMHKDRCVQRYRKVNTGCAVPRSIVVYAREVLAVSAGPMDEIQVTDQPPKNYAPKPYSVRPDRLRA